MHVCACMRMRREITHPLFNFQGLGNDDAPSLSWKALSPGLIELSLIYFYFSHRGKMTSVSLSLSKPVNICDDL